MANYHDMEMRVVYAQTLNELIERNPNVFCLEADLGKASATVPEVSKRNPRNYINTGVQEANMIGVGAGMAREGKIPFCATFTAFATRRCYDQITISVAYANNNVKIVGTSPGITQGPNGGARSLFPGPGSHARHAQHARLQPGGRERAALRHVLHGRQPPADLHAAGPGRVPRLFEEGCAFDPLTARRLHAGGDVTVVATGYMTRYALDVARTLEAEGIAVDLLHYPSVKPFDAETLVASAKRTGRVVGVENQNVVGGLGSAVCEVLSERHPVPVKRLGVPDKFGEVADQDYLFNKHGFGPEHIAQACRAMVKSK